MTPSTTLDGTQRLRLQKALRASYDFDTLTDLLQRVNRSYDDLVPRNANWIEAVRSVVEKAERNRWLPQLVEAVYEEYRSDDEWAALNEELQMLYRAQVTTTEHEIVDFYKVRFLRSRSTPLVDRDNLRNTLKDMIDYDSRILIVDGPKGSGKTYSAQLISFVKENLEVDSPPIAWVDLLDFALAGNIVEVSATDIGESIAAQWGFEGMPRLQNEQEARWGMRFCDWLTGKLDSAGPKRWIVIDHFDKSLLSQGAEDLISALAIRAYRNLSRLRLVLLSYKRYEELKSRVQAPIEYEKIQPIGTPELSDFLNLEFKHCMMRRQVTYTDEDIDALVDDSIEWVMSQIDDADERRLEYLGRAIAAVVNQFEHSMDVENQL